MLFLRWDEFDAFGRAEGVVTLFSLLGERARVRAVQSLISFRSRF